MSMYLCRSKAFLDAPILRRSLFSTLLLCFNFLRIMFTPLHPVLPCKLVIKGLSLAQRSMVPLTLLEGALDFIFTARQVLPIGYFVVFVLTNVPVGLQKVILCNNAEIIAPKQCLDRFTFTCIDLIRCALNRRVVVVL